ETYTLQWSISTACHSTSDDINVAFNHTPTVADAGDNQSFNDGTTSSTTLEANMPEEGTAQWSLISGDGGGFDNINSPNALFAGQLEERYTLRWSIETSCNISSDELLVSFSYGLDNNTQVVEVTNPTTGKTWMDRNLGAAQVATSSTDEEAYGDLYQWGRTADGHQIRTSNTTSTLSSSDTPGHGDFIIPDSNPYDWRNPKNDNLWQGLNGTNNPCPAGFRLPTVSEWNAEIESWSSNNSAGAYASPLKLTLAGKRHASYGSVIFVGSRGWYWSSNVDDVCSQALDFTSSNAFTYSSIRADGFSVRCIKDYE
ncbi:MAG: hypothetical protein ACOCWC_05725, partial [Bacteroidota bacterium]